MENVHKTLGHIRAFKGMRDGRVVQSSLDAFPADRLVWAGPLSTGTSFLSPTPPAHDAAHDEAGANTRLMGAYRRKGGRELRYTYSGSYGVNSEGSWWRVVVRCNRRPRGMPSGILKGVTSPDEASIRALVERSIEDLVQMQE